MVQGLFGQSKVHRILNFCPDKPGGNEFAKAKVLIYTVPEMYKADIRISTINVANCPLNVITFRCFLLVKVSFESPKLPFFFMSSSWLMIC